MMRNKSGLNFLIFIIFGFLGVSIVFANDDLISVFPLTNYDQTISHWINAENENFDQPLITKELQKQHYELFYQHVYGAFSPWDVDYVRKLIYKNHGEAFKAEELEILSEFNNKTKSEHRLGYAENYRPFGPAWIEEIEKNVNLTQFDQLTYSPYQRGIAIDNLQARMLPTADPHFYSHKLAGQGFPFDNLEISSLWAGTPVYIVAQTKDQSWTLVMAPAYIGWVKSNGIARVDDFFIRQWQAAAKKSLGAIAKTKTPIIDENNQFLFSAYIGSVFPVIETGERFKIMVPVMQLNRTASIRFAEVSNSSIVSMPLTPTPHQFANIMSTLIGRPYGWGNLYFYNDCSAEIKSLFTPFGIWLPRHSSNQMEIGSMVDLSELPKEKRLAYLMENAKPFLSIVYLGGHVVLYVGNYPNPNDPDKKPMAMTYQNIWGLSPRPAIRRAVIGQSVLFPMLLQYPEDLSFTSLADKKYFQVSFLDQLSNLKQPPNISLKMWMAPDL